MVTRDLNQFRALGSNQILIRSCNLLSSLKHRFHKCISRLNASHRLDNNTDLRIIDDYLIIMYDRVFHRISRKIAKIKDILYLNLFSCPLRDLFFINS